MINAVLFSYAYFRQTDKLTDFSYSFSFIIVVLVAYSFGSKGSGQSLILAAVILWALRLGGFLVWRIRKMGRDKRFDGRRENLPKFGSFWLAQAISVPVILLPALWLFDSSPASFNGLMAVGLLIWLLGLATESVADFQKSQFAANSSNTGKWIDEGLWRYSRHPNYLGEIAVWLGVYLASFSYLSAGHKLFGLISPLYIAILLRYISGVPLLENSAQEKWGSNPGYKKYVERTGLILPKLHQ